MKKCLLLALCLITYAAHAQDIDNNGVPDNIEEDLITKFKPCLILPPFVTGTTEGPDDHNVAPRPVDIMRLWAAVLDINGDFVCYTTYSGLKNLTSAGYTAWSPTTIGTAIVRGNLSLLSSDVYYECSGYVHPDYPPAPRYFCKFFYDWAGPDHGDGYYDTPSGWYEVWENGRTAPNGFVYNPSGKLYPNTMYTHIFVHDGETVIQYYFFYPINNFVNNHEGDWEHINVVLTSQDVNSAKIKRVIYYFHKWYYIADKPQSDYPTDFNCYVLDQTHPVVFVGGYWAQDFTFVVNLYRGYGPGSHGSYPVYGLWGNIKKVQGQATSQENIFAPTDFIKYNHWNTFQTILLRKPSYYDFNIDTELSWLSSNLYFGSPDVESPAWDIEGYYIPGYGTIEEVGNTGPKSPYYNGWEVVDWDGCGFEYYTDPLPYKPPSLAGFIWPVDNTAPTITITYPTAGLVFLTGTNTNIKWNICDNIGGYNGIKEIWIYYSTDNGINWQPITGAQPTYINDGSHSWTIPDVIYKNCIIKIVSYDAVGNVASSISSSFVIRTNLSVPTISGTATYSGAKAELPDVSLRSYVNKPYADQSKYKPRYCEFTGAGRIYGGIDCGTYYYASILHEAVSLPRTYTAKWVYNIWEDGVVVGLVEGPVSSSITVYPPNPYDPIVSETNTPEATAYSNGKKIVVDANGKIHIVYVSGDNVFYTASSDECETWTTPIVVGSGKHPAIELTADNLPTICWNNANCLYSAKMVSGVFEEPQLIYTGPEGTEISYLSYVLDQSTNNSYLGWVDEGAAGSAVLISTYNPSISNSLSPTPIDQGGTTAFKSPSLALDRTGNLKIAWSHSGKIYFKDNSEFAELGENGIHPIVDAYGDKTTVVWQEEIAPGIYQVVKKSKDRNGWSDKEVISYADSLNADFPVVVAGQYVYSKNVSGKDYDLIWNAEYDDGWSLHTQNISGAQGGISRYPSIACKQDWPKSKLYMVWTEEMTESKNGSKAIVPLVKAYVKSVDPVPVYYIDLGTEKADAFTIDKNGALYYGLQPEYSVDYHQTELKYKIQNLNPSKKYRIKVVYYQETGKVIKQTLTVDRTFNAKSKIESKTVVVEEHWIPNSCVKDGQIEISITKNSGDYAVCSVIALYEYNRDCDGKSNDDLADGINRSSSAISYYLMQNYPNPNTGKTSIKYNLARPGMVSLKIYNTLGQVVKTLVSQEQPEGIYNVIWDGRDNNGEISANGVYFYRLESGDYQETKKMVIVK